ncbi:hypothetical protein D018_5189B, partial [Vibrio parahaemolyticus VP2007-007]
HHI